MNLLNIKYFFLFRLLFFLTTSRDLLSFFFSFFPVQMLLSLTLCFSKPIPPKITKIPLGKSSDCDKLFFAKPRPTRGPHMSSTVGASPSDQGTVGGEAPSQSRMDSGSSDDVLVQYVVLRRDLINTWPLGSVVTQGCHASVAAVWAHRDHPDTLGYCSDSNLDHMHKVCSTKCLALLVRQFVPFYFNVLVLVFLISWHNLMLCYMMPFHPVSLD